MNKALLPLFAVVVVSCGGTSSPSMNGTAGSSDGSAGAVGRAGAVGGAGASGTAGMAMTGSAGATGTAGAPAAGIWMPQPGVTWQWQLSGKLDTTITASVFDIDLFDNAASVIQTLHAAGHSVICYFSAGSYEPGRPDSAALMQTGLGSTLDGWPNEKWLDVRVEGVRTIMKGRLDVARSKGCDGVEPDNVDGYANKNGLGLTKADQVAYDTFLATEGHARGLSVGLKNALDLVPTLVSSFDWALNEQCLEYDECDTLKPFVAAKKAVFHCEYATSTTGICNKDPAGFSTIVKDLDLDAWRLTCP